MPSPDLAILRHLAASTHASAAEIGIACRMTAAEVRGRLAMLESMRFVSGRQDPDNRVPPRRVYSVTAEGRRETGISGARVIGPRAYSGCIRSPHPSPMSSRKRTPAVVRICRNV